MGLHPDYELDKMMKYHRLLVGMDLVQKYEVPYLARLCPKTGGWAQLYPAWGEWVDNADGALDHPPLLAAYFTWKAATRAWREASEDHQRELYGPDWKTTKWAQRRGGE